MNVYEAAVKFVADTTGLKTQLAAGADSAALAAGESSGSRFSERFGGKMKEVIGGAIGGGLGIVSGMMLRGAGDLNTAAQQYAADTGATIDETAAAGKAIAGLFQDNLASMGEIGKVLSTLRTDMGMTADEANAAAGAFLHYAEASGQAAPDATRAIDGVLKAWNLTAADATGIMDLLIASHQQFGTSVTASQETLQKLAPAMQAANLTVSDGVGYLNLFQRAGVDSSAASMAFGKALTKVKSPAELQTLIDKISATRDPFERAKLAADLFGVRAGPKMAQALSEGKLSDFTMSLDSVAGASDKAAVAIDSSFGNQFQLLMHKAGGALADIGTNFGPLIIGFTMMLPALTPVLLAAGAGLGAILGGALAAAVALWPVLLIAAVAAAVLFIVNNPKIVGKILEFAKDLLQHLGNFLSTLPTLLAGIFQKAFNVVVGAVPGFLANLAGLILKLPGMIVAVAGQLLTFFGGIFGSLLTAAAKFVGELVRWFMGIPGRLVSLGGDIVSSIIRGIGSLPGKIADVIRNAFSGLHIDVGPFHISASGVSIDMPHFAGGVTGFSGGMALVGENGPELAYLPRGTNVMTASETAQALRSGVGGQDKAGNASTGGNTYIVQVQGLLRARNAHEIGDNLRRLSDFGVLPGSGSVA